MKPRTVALGLAVVLMTGGGMAAQRVSADAFGQRTKANSDQNVALESGSIPDDLVHTYCFEDSVVEGPPPDFADVPLPVPDYARKAVHAQMQNLARQTRYRVHYQPRCDERTDVKVRPTSSAWGDWRCTTFVPAGDRCEQGELGLAVQMVGPEFEESYKFPGIDQLYKTTCHEIGHSVGLAHGEGPGYDDCMESGIPHPNPARTYNAHHVDHINSRVPTDH